ncbi:MAG: FCD domain-containing protein [Atribacterota bacterium]
MMKISQQIVIKRGKPTLEKYEKIQNKVLSRSFESGPEKDHQKTRGVLEGLTARLAAVLITEKKIKVLETCNEDMGKFIRKNNVLAYEKESDKFYELILDVCGNDRLVQIRKNLTNHIYRFWNILLTSYSQIKAKINFLEILSKDEDLFFKISF